MAVKRKLTRKQILAGFGGHRRQQLAKPGPAKRQKGKVYSAKVRGRRVYATSKRIVKRSSVKRSSVKSKLAKVGVLAGVTAAAAAAGVGLTKFVQAQGGVKAIVDSVKAGFDTGGIAGAIVGLNVLTTPAMINGVTAAITPAQAEQLFYSMPQGLLPYTVNTAGSGAYQPVDRLPVDNTYDEYGNLAY